MIQTQTTVNQFSKTYFSAIWKSPIYFQRKVRQIILLLTLLKGMKRWKIAERLGIVLIDLRLKKIRRGSK